MIAVLMRGAVAVVVVVVVVAGCTVPEIARLAVDDSMPNYIWSALVAEMMIEGSQ